MLQKYIQSSNIFIALVFGEAYRHSMPLLQFSGVSACATTCGREKSDLTLNLTHVTGTDVPGAGPAKTNPYRRSNIDG
ncbi:MAG: hypothetical protein NT178_13920 [Proteobacteria bacterium]|nr:hypothetical protein [Pseudomonadota bacterium]